MDKLIIENLFKDEYNYEDKLGNGSYGKVYLVSSCKSGKNYALKLLNSDINIDSFNNEVQTMKKLNNQDSILSIEDYGVKNEEYPYIVSDYQNGGDILGFIKERNSIDETVAIEILTSMLDALEFAHSKDILHKDIKPENIFVHKINNSYHYCLGDWGLSNIKTNSSHTTMKGTIDYMPPELCKAKAKRYKSSDIYSLGATFYYMVFGKKVYGIDDDTETMSIPELHKYEKLIIPPCSAKIEAIISKMLEKDPQKRATIDEIRQLLKDDVRQSFEMGSINLEIDDNAISNLPEVNQQSLRELYTWY
ncbi:MAG: serine/threonine-protein kinase [Campylobacterota bacterium]|nr:serine/threonine-protein kinase [Campylobacterota bacterium]